MQQSHRPEVCYNSAQDHLSVQATKEAPITELQVDLEGVSDVGYCQSGPRLAEGSSLSSGLGMQELSLTALEMLEGIHSLGEMLSAHKELGGHTGAVLSSPASRGESAEISAGLKQMKGSADQLDASTPLGFLTSLHSLLNSLSPYGVKVAEAIIESGGSLASFPLEAAPHMDVDMALYLPEALGEASPEMAALGREHARETMDNATQRSQNPQYLEEYLSSSLELAGALADELSALEDQTVFQNCLIILGLPGGGNIGTLRKGVSNLLLAEPSGAKSTLKDLVNYLLKKGYKLKIKDQLGRHHSMAAQMGFIEVKDAANRSFQAGSEQRLSEESLSQVREALPTEFSATDAATLLESGLGSGRAIAEEAYRAVYSMQTGAQEALGYEPEGMAGVPYASSLRQVVSEAPQYLNRLKGMSSVLSLGRSISQKVLGRSK